MSDFFSEIIKKISSRFSKDISKSTEISDPFIPDAEEKIITEPLQFSEKELKIKSIKPKQLIVGVAKDVGRQRQNNEDSLYALTTVIDSNESSTSFGIFIVADGMGGHNNGEVASELAVRSVSHHLINTLHPAVFSPEPFAPENSLQEILTTGIIQANDLINKHSNGGGTTLTVVITIGLQMTIAHVGDSRAYSIFLDGKFEPLTRDHSLVSRLVELGQITEEEAKTHPQKSTLYNSVGQRDTPQADIFTAKFPEPGFLMICSDGLWGVLSEEEMFSIIVSAPSVQQACQELVDAANNAGGPDNITVILAKLSE